MFNVLDDINWFTVAIGTFAFYLLGAVWFSPLFGKAYDRATGVTRSTGQKWPAIYYVGPFVSCFGITVATAILTTALGIDELPESLVFGLIAGVGYAGSVALSNAITPNMPKPLLFASVTGAYNLVGILVVSTIVSS